MQPPTLPSIADLTAAMAAGERRAIETFYRRYFDRMLSMARRAAGGRLSRDEAFALDVVHDATLRIVRCVGRMESEAHLLNWTRLVVQSCALDRIREEQRRRQRECKTAGSEIRADDGFDAAAEEQLAWLREQIAAMEPSLAEVIRLRFSEGWTLAKLAARVGTTTGQVDGKLRRAIRTLRHRAEAVFDD